MNIAITGATGFIGSQLAELATQQGHRVIGFTRHPEKPIPHCAETRAFVVSEPPDLSGCDAVVNLAGENVFGIWTVEKKQRIRESRIAGTRAIVEAIRASANPPKVLVSGSAIGFYGDTGETTNDEDSSAGDGFLAEVVRDWEAEALRAQNAEETRTRVVLLRTSVVLGKTGGALPKMLTPFRLSLGGRLGDGEQWMAWIHIDDITRLILFAIETMAVSGPLNACAPEPVRNRDFTHSLAAALHRPAILPVPKFALQKLLGEFSHELLDNKRILPKRALDAGFKFQFPTLDVALADLLR